MRRIIRGLVNRTVPAAVALTAGFLAAGVGSAAAAPAPATEISCDGNHYHTSWGRVVGVDWLKVHQKPALSSATVGQLKLHTSICEAPSKESTHPGVYLLIGYNGSTLVKGWVDYHYVSLTD